MHTKLLEFKLKSYFYGKHTFKLFYCLIVLYFLIHQLKLVNFGQLLVKLEFSQHYLQMTFKNINSQLNSLFDQSASMMDGWSLLGYGGFFRIL